MMLVNRLSFPNFSNNCQQHFPHNNTNNGVASNSTSEDTHNKIPMLVNLKMNSKSKTSHANFETLFLHGKLEELLRELHQEIHDLKTENGELKFQLTLSKRSDQLCENIGIVSKIGENGCSSSEASFEDSAESAVALKNPENYNQTSEIGIDGADIPAADNNQKIESENGKVVVACTRSIHVQTDPMSNTCHKRIGTQELSKIVALHSHEDQKLICFPDESGPIVIKESEAQITEFKDVKNKEFYSPRASIPNASTINKNNEFQYCIPRQRSSSASSKYLREPGSRKSSFSLLPANYKETVATLPPIILSPKQGIFPVDDDNIKRYHHHRRNSKAWTVVERHGPNYDPTLLTKLTSTNFRKEAEVEMLEKQKQRKTFKLFKFKPSNSRDS